MITDSLFRDIKIGLRVLIKEKGFCALAVIVLALGIAGVTTMFSVVNGVMLRGFSFPNSDRLASLNFVDPPSSTFFGVNGQISAMDFEDLLPQQQSFDALAAYLNGSTVNVTVDGHPQRYTGAYVTENFLRILGVAPMMGRDFTAADNASGAGKVAIIGYGIWQSDFGGDPDIIGKGLRINGKPATVVGVMSQGLRVSRRTKNLDSAVQRFPAPAARHPGRQQSRGPRSAEKRCLAGPGQRRSDDDRETSGRARTPTPTSSSIPAKSSVCSTHTRHARCEARCGRCSGSAWGCC